MEVCSLTSAGLCPATFTDASGHYTIVAVPDGNYRITAAPPQKSLLLSATVPSVTVLGGDVVQNVVLKSPLAGAGTLDPSHVNNTQPAINWRDTVTRSVFGCVGATATFVVTKIDQLGNTIPIAQGNATETTPGTYAAIFGPVYPNHDQARISVTLDCPSGPEEVNNLDMWIDPSGYVLDTRGDPIEGATVTLFFSDIATQDKTQFSPLPDGSPWLGLGGSTKNPDITGADGLFQWFPSTAMTGNYFVRAEAPNCHDPANPNIAYVDTRMLPILPPAPITQLGWLPCPENAPYCVEPLVLECTAYNTKLIVRQLVINQRQKTTYLESIFALKKESNGINPANEAFTLKVADFTTTIPAGSFHRRHNGSYSFAGKIDTVWIEVLIEPLRHNRYQVQASAQGAHPIDIKNPVAVEIDIGDDRGTATVKAKITPCQIHRGHDECR